MKRREFICQSCKALKVVMLAGVTSSGLALQNCSDDTSCGTINLTVSATDVENSLKGNGYLNTGNVVLIYLSTDNVYRAFANCCPEGGGGVVAAESPSLIRCQKENRQTYTAAGVARGEIDYSNPLTTLAVTQNNDGSITITG